MSYYRINKVRTDAPLDESDVYTSDAFQTRQFDRLTGIAYSDQDGTLVVQQSSDGTNWDHETSVTVTGETGEDFDVKVYGEWARLQYTNGDTAQTEFRLACYATVMG